METFLMLLSLILAAACGVAFYGRRAALRRASEASDALAAARLDHESAMAAAREEWERSSAAARTAAEEALAAARAETAEALRGAEQARIARVAAEKDAEALRGRLAEEQEQLREKNEMLMLRIEKVAEEMFERKSRQMRDTNKESMDLILKPLRDNITEFRRRVEEIYSAENESRGAMKNELGKLMELNRRITEQTDNLTTALRGDSKLQGDWGEMILDTILESSDLRKGIHYTTQTTVRDAEGNNVRPDVILNMPDGKRVVIDSKVSLTAYVNYCSCTDEESRRRAMAEHIRSVRNHVNELGRKSYQDSVLGSPDFVIMFVPTEPAFLAAVQADPEIWNDAYRRKVIVSSPTNLFGMLKIVDDLWKRDDMGRNAERIAREGALMYDKFVGFVTTLETIGKNIDTLHGNYEKAFKQLSSGTGNLVSRAQRLSALNVKVSKSLPKSVVDEADDDPDPVEEQ